MIAWLKSRPAVSWALYDWGNSAFATTVMAGFFPAFFRQFWSAGADGSLTTYRLGMANAAAGFVIALLAPLLGAIADRGGQRKRMLLAFSLLGIATTLALYFVGQGQWLVAATLFALATLGFNGGVVFYDALLLDVAQPGELDRVSALGYALGYLGGGLLFALNVLMVVKPALFGLHDAAEAVRWSFVTVSVWWLVFLLPLMLYVREAPPDRRRRVMSARGPPAGANWRATARRLRRHTDAAAVPACLLAVHRRRQHHHQDGRGLRHGAGPQEFRSHGRVAADAVRCLSGGDRVWPAGRAVRCAPQPVAGRGGVCGGHGVGLLPVVGPGVLCHGRGGRTGAGRRAEPVALACTAGWCPKESPAEFFGFYNMVGKFGTVLGPALMGVMALLTGSTRASILSLLLLFVVGGVLLYRVRSGAEGRATH